jgi:NADPH:quinone reductase-like Zn-dependent oxidoreductase
MRACIHTSYGPPEVLQFAELPKPIPSDNEVLIRVHAATVNRTDCGFRSAEYFVSRFFSGLFKPNNPVLGSEFAGVIEAVGKQVTVYAPGDNVFGYNDITFGAYAEYIVMSEDAPMALLPKGYSFQDAAPLLEGSHYALVDIRAAKVEAGMHVLVNGATGAIGSAAVQLLKYFGATVTAVCAKPHMDLVKALGADEVIDYTQEDFTQRHATFDFVFDAVGKSTFGKCKRILKDKGVYISTELGPGGQNIFLALLTPLLGGKRLLFPLPTISKEDVLLIRELADSGKFKPVVDRVYPFDQLIEAHRYVETRQKIGNVVIAVNPV